MPLFSDMILKIKFQDEITSQAKTAFKDIGKAMEDIVQPQVSGKSFLPKEYIEGALQKMADKGVYIYHEAMQKAVSASRGSREAEIQKLLTGIFTSGISETGQAAIINEVGRLVSGIKDKYGEGFREIADLAVISFLDQTKKKIEEESKEAAKPGMMSRFWTDLKKSFGYGPDYKAPSTSETVANAIHKGFEKVKGIFSGITSSFTAALGIGGGIGSFLTKLLQPLSQMMEVVMAPLQQSLIPFFLQMVQALQPLVYKVVPALTHVFMALAPIIEKLADIFVDLLIPTLESFAKFLEWLMPSKFKREGSMIPQFQFGGGTVGGYNVTGIQGTIGPGEAGKPEGLLGKLPSRVVGEKGGKSEFTASPFGMARNLTREQQEIESAGARKFVGVGSGIGALIGGGIGLIVGGKVGAAGGAAIGAGAVAAPLETGHAIGSLAAAGREAHISNVEFKDKYRKTLANVIDRRLGEFGLSEEDKSIYSALYSTPFKGSWSDITKEGVGKPRFSKRGEYSAEEIKALSPYIRALKEPTGEGTAGMFELMKKQERANTILSNILLAMTTNNQLVSEDTRSTQKKATQSSHTAMSYKGIHVDW